MSVDVTYVEQQRPNLGRQRAHDSRSRSFPTRVSIDRSRWVTKLLRIYDPRPNPNQCHGECTGVAKCVQMNAVGNRVKGVTLNMDNAHTIYHTATAMDEFEGDWPPDDTGSSGLASAKAAQKLGLGGEYLHVFNGADEVVQLIQQNHVVSVGTWWYDDMFNPDGQGIIQATGIRVGGHQYAARGYDLKSDLVIIRCWWGDYRDVKIKRDQLNQLLLDEGDAHIQTRVS
jgi:hypothetical protein